MGLPPKLGETGAQSLSRPRKQLIESLIRVAIGLVISVIIVQIKFDYLEALLFDVRIRFKPSPQVSQKVEIILADTKTSQALRGVPGFKEHTELLNRLAKASPYAVVYVRSFARIRNFENQYSEEDLRGFPKGSDDDKKAFAEAAQKISLLYMQTDVLGQAAEKEQLQLESPFENIKVGSGPKTSDKNILAKDGVSRRALISYQNQPLLHYQLATHFNPKIAKAENIRGKTNIFDSEQIYLDYARPGSFSTTKLEDILLGQVDLAKYKDKIVLIGDDLGLSAKDYVATPFTRNPDSRSPGMTVTELHANMFDTFIRNSAPIQTPSWLNILFTLAIAIFTLNVVLIMRPLSGILILMAVASGFGFISWLAMWVLGVWVEMSHPLLAVFICYYFFIPYRLIIENRRSWEYYQKNKLLSQVEELKTNFISMMSHDLKTPIARIQGMTDMILKDPVVLSSTQREALDTIKGSSTDLLSFINSILNYARIESQGVELHRKAKDINQLILDVVRRHEFLAKLKHIKIETKLEPLFSLSIDPDLIKQVFSNLLENAIKYSPDHSTVTIQSSEIDGSIRVEFIDHAGGIPEDELTHVFMKFFRSRNAKATTVKGSGLGLYLAKYFVELHQGRIFVKSELEKGSTFTVELPIRS